MPESTALQKVRKNLRLRLSVANTSNTMSRLWKLSWVGSSSRGVRANAAVALPATGNMKDVLLLKRSRRNVAATRPY